MALVFNQSTVSCGVKQVSTLTGLPLENVREMARWLLEKGGKAAHFVWSDLAGASPGAQLTDMVRKLKIGTVTATPPGINPNTQNTVVAWIWTIDNVKLNKWYKGGMKPPKDPFPDGAALPDE